MASTSQKKSLKKSSPTTTDILRGYGLPESYIRAGKKGLRYRQPLEKGVYWYWLARYIRARDAFKWGSCISCGKPKSFEQLQAGHFMPAGSCGFALLFDERNLNGECERCNAWDDTHLLGYAENLDLRYGKDTARGLRVRYEMRNSHITREWSRADYEVKIPLIKARYEVLAQKLNLSTTDDVQKE